MKISRKSLNYFLREQVVFLAVAAIAAAVFWATGQEVNPLTIVLYALLFGNLVAPAMRALGRVYWSRPFPWNWITFWGLLLAIVGPVYVLCSTIVWGIAPSSHPPLGEYLAANWKFPMVIIIVFSMSVFAYRITRERLEQRNLELQRSVERGAEEIQVQKQELLRAREIQESLLPKAVPQLSGFEISAAWRPALEVSGDYFDVFRLGERRMGLCIADVVGKGVSAALLMANVQAAVRAFAAEGVTPAVLCDKVNRLLCENIAVGKFVTFLFGILDSETRSFAYCNAGHLEPILVKAGRAATLNSGGAVLGVFPSWNYEEGTVELERGDRLLLFTDGISEAEGPGDEEFSESRIAALAQSEWQRPAAELNSLLLDRVDAFCGGHFRDDATLLVIAAV
ncbi:MAG TPA: PP2C family protein-serine/threonine phosphatase [Terracidiphilus sp.]|nr:PP2C family protein-serine/threonine phosphatase [Terracidiphilus sp.]